MAVRKIVLYHFPHNPWPPRSGAHQRCLAVLAALKSMGFEVHFFSSVLFSDQPWTSRAAAILQDQLGVRPHVYMGSQEDRQWTQAQTAAREPGTMFKRLLPPGLRAAFRRKCLEIRPDVLIVSYSLWANFLRDFPEAGISAILDTHDVISLNSTMQAQLLPLLSAALSGDSAALKKVTAEDFFSSTALGISRTEIQACQGYQSIFAVSKLEQQILSRFLSSPAVQYVPITMETKKMAMDYSGPPVFVVGKGNPFNSQGYLYLVSRVLPLLQAKKWKGSVRMAGTGSASLPACEGVECIGSVENLSAVYQAGAFAICPLIGGTGQQVKVIEAMSHGLPVLTLANVAANLPIVHGENGWIAKNANEFANAMVMLGQDSDLCRRLGKKALETVAVDHSPQIIQTAIRSVMMGN